jgi:hypothetical protein
MLVHHPRANNHSINRHKGAAAVLPIQIINKGLPAKVLEV